MKFIFLIFVQFFLTSLLYSQTFSGGNLKEGYIHQNDTTYFIFDASWYKVENVEKAIVTGAFRQWDHDMNSPEWTMKKTGNGLWTLAVYNPKYEKIPAASPFKFRINDGEWLNPPAGTPNEQGGNLVFLFGVQPPSLKAEIRTSKSIWFKLSGTDIVRSANPIDYKLTDAKGKEIKIAAIENGANDESVITPSKELDIKRIFYLEYPKYKLKVMVSFDGWFRNLYSAKELGANISENGKSTAFRIFSPRAEKLKLYLYKKAEDKKPYKTVDMKRDKDGVWERVFPQNLNKIWYDFTVHGAGDPGNHFYETNPVHISDPYARVSDDTWGKSRVWMKTKPAAPLKNGIPKMEDVIAYEVHVQDFTAQLPVSSDLRGTIPAVVMPGLKNSRGEKIGFDYLVDLGINVVHLMPMQEYLNYPDDEWKENFKDDPFMIEQGINLEQYDWGYRTTHSFAIETRYRKRGTEKGSQREQFRDLVQAFHDKGIAVVVDFVFNHTGENMDGTAMWFNFNVLDKLYYYRTKNGEHIGEYGNETKSENRPMGQRWFIDQCKHFIDEFGVDGFRIDLAGQTDEQTLKAIKNAIGPDKIVYGEPWIASNDPDYEANPDWDWYKIDAPITYFQDDARNAFKGPSFFDPKTKENVKGWAGGNSELRDLVKLGLTNGWPEEKNPNRGINYLDIHDNWTLADQFALKEFDGRKGIDEISFKTAAVLLYTSLGPIITNGGTEIMRSKGLAPTVETVKQTKKRKLYFNGRRDTNTHRTANEFIWENVGATREDANNYFPNEKSSDDFKNMLEFWKGLNHFRMSETGKVFRIGYEPPSDYYQFIEPSEKTALGYIVDKKVMVLINTDTTSVDFENLQLPEGNWKLIGNSSKIDFVTGVNNEIISITAGSKVDIALPKHELKIWKKE